MGEDATGGAIDGPRRPAASGETKALVALLHGYGADGHDLFGLAEPLASVLPDAAFVSPHAPEPMGMTPNGRRWFPIPWIDGAPEAEMQASFIRSAGLLDMFLDAELARHGLSDAALALVGFSQGTMMSLHVAPRRAAACAGIVGFSGRLVAPERLAEETRVRPPVQLIHGDQDELLPASDMLAAASHLADAGFEVGTHLSRGVGHGVAPDGLQTAAAFLKERLSQ